MRQNYKLFAGSAAIPMEPILELGEFSSVEELELGKAYKGIAMKGRVRLNKLVSGTLKGAPKLEDGEPVVAKLVKRSGSELVFSFVSAGETEAQLIDKAFQQKTAAELREWDFASVRGRVFCVEKAGISRGFLLDGTGAAIVETQELEEGAFVEAGGEVKAGSPPIIAAQSVRPTEVGETDAKVSEYLERNSKPLSFNPLVGDAVMKALSPKIAECARFLKRRLLEFQPVMLRYHGDADGVCSAILVVSALKKFLSSRGISTEENRFLLTTTQTDSAIYSQRDLAMDVEKAALLPKKPVMVFLDHSANQESFEQVKTLRESGHEVVIVDHHPPSPGIAGAVTHFVSPFLAGGSAHHTAGLLCFDLANAIAGGADERLAQVSMQGDKSIFAKPEPLKEPRVIDYLAAYNDPESPEFYAAVLSDPKKVDYYFEEANNRVKRALAASKPFVKQKNVGAALLVTVKLDKFCKKGEYPPKGSVLNEIHREASEASGGAATVSIGTGGDSITFRANHAAFEAGFKASQLILLLKQEFPYAVVSGGGHDVAASMRVREEFLQSVLDRTLQLTEEALAKAPPKTEEKHAESEIKAEEAQAKMDVEDAV